MKYIELVKKGDTSISDKVKPENGPFIGMTEDGEIIFSDLEPYDGPADNEIWYTTTDGEPIAPFGGDRNGEYNAPFVEGVHYLGNSRLISNTYENGKGVLTFDKDISFLSGTFFSGQAEDAGYVGDYVRNLETVSLPRSVKLIDDYAFCDTPLKQVIFPIKSQLTSIGNWAFTRCSLENITIPNSVVSIKQEAFRNCTSLNSVTLGRSLSYIDRTAFYKTMLCSDNLNNLSQIAIDESNNYLGMIFYDKKVNGLYIIDTKVISSQDNMTTANVPEGITELLDYSLSANYNLQEVILPSSIQHIHRYAFPNEYEDQIIINYLGNLAQWLQVTPDFAGHWSAWRNKQLFVQNSLIEGELIVPNSVYEIKDYCFNDYDYFTSVIIGDDVRTIGSNAFAGTKQLTKVTIGKNVEYIHEDAFCEAYEERLPLKEITMLNPNPCRLESRYSLGYSGTYWTWDDELGEEMEIRREFKIYVPAGSGQKYKAHPDWQHLSDYIIDDYTPTVCTDLKITAEGVNGRKTTTTVYYEAITNGVNSSGEVVSDIIITGIGTSSEFEQNESYTDAVERTVTFEFMGVTATTTITQGVWIDTDYTVELNDQWRLSETQSNPDSTLYDGVYESFSNIGKDNGKATMYINLTGYSEFDIYIRSYAEGNYDYVTISEPNSDVEKATTKGKQNSGQNIGSYTRVHYTNLTGDDRITITYRKDSSDDSGNDQGYVLIGKVPSILPEREYIDLGLPSGTKWENLNRGADFYEECGGRTDEQSWREYLDEPDGVFPNKVDARELLDNCTIEYVLTDDSVVPSTNEQYRYKGVKLTSNINGNSIFIPVSEGNSGGGIWLTDGSLQFGYDWDLSIMDAWNSNYEYLPTRQIERI